MKPDTALKNVYRLPFYNISFTAVKETLFLLLVCMLSGLLNKVMGKFS